MSWILNPDDWLGRHPRVCLLLVAALIVLAGVIEG